MAISTIGQNGLTVPLTSNTITSASATALTLQSAGTTAVTVDTSQNVGIGTASPTQKLEVATASGGTICLRYIGNSGNVTLGTDANNNMLFSIGNPPTEKMRIDSSGNVGIGITPYTTSSRTVLSVVTGSLVYQSGVSNGNSSGVFNNFANIAGADKNVVTGYSQGIVMNNDGTGKILTLTTSGTTSAGGLISFTAGPYVSAGGTSWTNSSDERLKNITGEISNGLAKVCSLRAAEFTWKDDANNKPQVGLIAQDVQAVLPEVINSSKKYNSEDETEYLGVNYTETIPLLVASIKELKAINDQQAETINALTARIVALEAK